MWKLVYKDKECKEIHLTTIKDLKNAIKDIPDNYSLSCIGVDLAMLKDDEEEVVAIDELSWVINTIEEQDIAAKERCKNCNEHAIIDNIRKCKKLDKECTEIGYYECPYGNEMQF